MFKEYICKELKKYFDKHGSSYRIPADLCFSEAIYYMRMRRVFEAQLEREGYRINGGFIEKI